MNNLTAFTLRSLGDLLTVISVAKRGGITEVTELETLVKNAISLNNPRDRRSKAQIQHKHVKSQQDRMPKVRCSLCHQFMKVLPVNDKPSTQVGGNYRSCGLCMNPECMNTEYFEETAKEKYEAAKRPLTNTLRS